MLIIEHIALVILMLSVVALLWLLLKKGCQVYEMTEQAEALDRKLRTVSQAITKERKFNDLLLTAALAWMIAIVLYVYYWTKPR